MTVTSRRTPYLGESSTGYRTSPLGAAVPEPDRVQGGQVEQIFGFKLVKSKG
jgi:hypothetical protein